MNADGWFRDIRYALRQLARAPAFTAVAVVTLSIGIGANTAIFSVVNTLLLSPPAHVLEPERVVTLWTSDFSGPPYGASSYPDYETFREQRDVVTDVAAFGLAPGNLVETDETVRLTLETVSPNYFDVLGVLAERGRAFNTADGDAPAVAVISHTLWQSHFGADDATVGRAIRLNAGTFTVVGVAPEGFDGSTRGLRVDAWVPIQATPSLGGGSAEFLDERGSRRFNLVGRLRPEVSIEQAQARFAVVA